MVDQYEIGRSNKVPGTAYRRVTRWKPFWDDITKAFAEGYTGWVTIALPDHKVVQEACQSLYYRRRGLPDSQSLDFCYRKQADATYILFARLLEKEVNKGGEDAR